MNSLVNNVRYRLDSRFRGNDAWRKLFLSLLLFCLITTFSHAAYATEQTSPSLFFTQDEITTIQSEAAKQPALFALEEKYKLTLQSIVYYAPDNWTLWLQNRAWTPATHDPHIRIEKVTPESVTLCAALASGRQTESLTLHPHETLNLLTGEKQPQALQPF